MMVKSICAFICLLFCFNMCNGQHQHAYESVKDLFWEKKDFMLDVDSLRQKFGKYKTYPKTLELECLVALSYYPELKDVKITFVSKDMTSVMKVQPQWGFFNLLRRRGQKKYIVQMNSNGLKNIAVDSLSFNACVGVIAHELAHIYQYTRTSLVGFGLRYLGEKGKIEVEREADKITIERRLGYSLYEMRYFLLHLSGRTEEQNKITRKFYLSPKEILDMIKQQTVNE